MKKGITTIKKCKNGNYKVINETTIQSIARDTATLAVFIGVITMDILFSMLIGKSILIDLLAVAMIILWFFMSLSKIKSKTISKEELIKELKESE